MPEKTDAWTSMDGAQMVEQETSMTPHKYEAPLAVDKSVSVEEETKEASVSTSLGKKDVETMTSPFDLPEPVTQAVQADEVEIPD